MTLQAFFPPQKLLHLAAGTLNIGDKVTRFGVKYPPHDFAPRAHWSTLSCSSTGWPNKNYTSFWYFRFIIRTKIKFWSYWRYISSFSQFLTPLSLIKMFKCFLWIMCVPSTHLMLVPIYQTPFWERFRTYPKMKNMLMLVTLSQIILQSVL